MKHHLCLLCLLLSALLAIPQAAWAKQEKRQNYVFLEGESQTVYHEKQILTGTAAWYGERLHGNKTSSGERFDYRKLTAAHRSLPFGTVLKVTNLNNRRQVLVRITDRGPLSTRFVIDLAKGAAKELNMVRSGIAPVTLEIVKLPEWYVKKHGGAHKTAHARKGVQHPQKRRAPKAKKR